jgi:uncharacterized protein (TIGR02145 family)
LIYLFAGQGTAVTASFAGINWGSKSKFLQTEIDIAGGNNYTDMGTTQLMSVPYALYANTAKSAVKSDSSSYSKTSSKSDSSTYSKKADSALYAANAMPRGTSAGQILYWNGSTWLSVTPGSYGQGLVFCDGVPSWGGCVPKVSTSALSGTASTSAIAGGNITSDGGSSITAKGVCWSISLNPTISLSTKTNEGAGAGAFTSVVSGLALNTTYYLRAYATNSKGTVYGNSISFTTSSFVNLTSVTIGSQIWSAKNLDVAKYRNGDPIPQVTQPTAWQNLTTGAWCWYNNDSATYAAVYGRLYNWYAVNDPRGLAPAGWHVANEMDWNRIGKYLDQTVDTTISINGNIGTTIGGSLKEIGVNHWYSPNSGATNISGFTGLPGGMRVPLDGSPARFMSIGVYGTWWTSDAWWHWIDCSHAGIYENNDLGINCGLSVRCVKD